MAPLPQNNTPRFKIGYVVSGHAHTLQIRSHLSPAALGSLVDSFLTQLSPKLYALTVGSVTFAADGSNIFNPVTTGIEGNGYGSGAGNEGVAPQYFDFVGRTTGGRRLRLAVFGATVLGTNYRFSPLEDDDVDDARQILVDAGGDIVAIDDLTPVWKVYVNAGNNAYWQRAVR